MRIVPTLATKVAYTKPCALHSGGKFPAQCLLPQWHPKDQFKPLVTPQHLIQELCAPSILVVAVTIWKQTRANLVKIHHILAEDQTLTTAG